MLHGLGTKFNELWIQIKEFQLPNDVPLKFKNYYEMYHAVKLSFLERLN